MKHLGRCTLCDEPCFEILETFTKGDVAGFAKKLGRPLETAMRVTVILMDGSHSDVTLCSSCPVTPETLPLLHQQMLETWAFEGSNGKREQMGGKSLDLAQEWQMGAWQLTQFRNIPLGILHEETWQEAMGRENG